MDTRFLFIKFVESPLLKFSVVKSRGGVITSYNNYVGVT